MYSEFIIGYILTGIVAVMLAVVIVLLCIILKKISRGGVRASNSSYVSYPGGSPYASGRGTVICRNCATQYDAAQSVCPKCRTPR